jgi:hypothetical protein
MLVFVTHTRTSILVAAHTHTHTPTHIHTTLTHTHAHNTHTHTHARAHTHTHITVSNCGSTCAVARCASCWPDVRAGNTIVMKRSLDGGRGEAWSKFTTLAFKTGNCGMNYPTPLVDVEAKRVRSPIFLYETPHRAPVSCMPCEIQRTHVHPHITRMWLEHNRRRPCDSVLVFVDARLARTLKPRVHPPQTLEFTPTPPHPPHAAPRCGCFTIARATPTQRGPSRQTTLEPRGLNPSTCQSPSRAITLLWPVREVACSLLAVAWSSCARVVVKVVSRSPTVLLMRAGASRRASATITARRGSAVPTCSAALAFTGSARPQVPPLTPRWRTHTGARTHTHHRHHHHHHHHVLLLVRIHPHSPPHHHTTTFTTISTATAAVHSDSRRRATRRERFSRAVCARWKRVTVADPRSRRVCRRRRHVEQPCGAVAADCWPHVCGVHWSLWAWPGAPLGTVCSARSFSCSTVVVAVWWRCGGGEGGEADGDCEVVAAIVVVVDTSVVLSQREPSYTRECWRTLAYIHARAHAHTPPSDQTPHHHHHHHHHHRSLLLLPPPPTTHSPLRYGKVLTRRGARRAREHVCVACRPQRVPTAGPLSSGEAVAV